MEVKTGQGRAGAAGGVKAVEAKKEEKKEADRALLRSLLAFAPSEVNQESRGFAEFRSSGVPDFMRVQRAASALMPLCAEGDGLRGRWSTGRGWGKGCTSRR